MNLRELSKVDDPSDDFDVLLDQISDRIHAGESIDLSELIQEHPQHAARLEHLVPAIKAMAELGSRSDASPRKHSDIAGAHQTTGVEGILGDFRVIREIGRGGMGVVYEAQQISLRRRVALKMLPFAAVLDDRQLQRFQNEAQAAAMLRHDNIVGVYSVGCDRGVHYYAMELIQGQSVAQAIQQLCSRTDSAGDADSESADLLSGCSLQESRESSEGDLPEEELRSKDETQPIAALSTNNAVTDQEYFRTVARLAMQAANALEYAHQRGVIHRDIKPSNLLLDGRGRICVADFGLAIIQGDSNLTLTGDVLGTLRYMSPEQAAGRKFVDPRTDVYSLGITLYELLALRPAFEADDRQQLLRQVIEEQPPSLRRLNPRIPIDLEKVVHKATAKEQENRYDTAQHFADDLDRFLDHRPVKARRTGRAGQSWRWAKRNRVLASLLVTTTCLLSFLAVAGPMIAWRESKLRQQSNELAAELLQSETTLQDQLYDAHMTSAQAALHEGAVDRVDELLRLYIPSGEHEKDLRGFEWFYLWRASRRAIEAPKITNWISIECLAYSSDGRHFAYGTWTGELFVCGARKRATLWSERNPSVGHADMIHAIEFSPDGQILATGSQDKTAILWHASSGEILQRLGPFPRPVVAVKFSPNGRVLAIGLDERQTNEGAEKPGDQIRLYDVATSAPVSRLAVEATARRSLAGGSGRVAALSFSRDGQLLAAARRDNHIYLWNVVTGEPRHIPVEGDLRCVAFSPVHPHLLVTGGGSFGSAIRWGETRLWNIDSGNSEAIERHPFGVMKIAFSDDGTRLATVDEGRTIGIWSVAESLHLLDTIRGHSARINDIAFSADRQTIASCSADNEIVFWDVATPPSVNEINAHFEAVIDLAFDPNCRMIASTGYDGTARVWDADSGQKLAEFPLTVPHGMSIDVSPDGALVALAGMEYPQNTPGELAVWDLVSRTKLRTLYDGTNGIWSVQFSPDGQRIAAGFDRKESGRPGLVVWDLKSGKEVTRVDVEPATSVRRLAWSPDGKHIATCTMADHQGGHGPVQLWDLETRKGDTVYPNAQGDLLCALAFSPDGSMIAAGSPNGWIRVWHVTDGKRTAEPERSLSAHVGFVWYLDFSPDSRRLVSAGADGSVRIWNVETGWELLTFREDPVWLWCAKFSRDGRTLAVGTNHIDSKIRLYRAASDHDVKARLEKPPTKMRRELAGE